MLGCQDILEKGGISYFLNIQFLCNLYPYFFGIYIYPKFEDIYVIWNLKI